MKCCNCGASLGMFKKYVTLSDGAICLKCFKSLGFDVDKKDEYINAKCREIQSGYGHYIKKQNMKVLDEHDLPTFTFAHYGEERDVDATADEVQMFGIICDMFKSKGYDPEQLRLVRKSKDYVAAAIGDDDVARFKATERVMWIVFPTAESGAVKHRMESVTEVYDYSTILDAQIEAMSKFIDIKK